MNDIGFVLFIGAVFAGIGYWFLYRTLLLPRVWPVTVARVTSARDGGDTKSVHYEFTVDGLRYQGSFNETSALTTGSLIDIHYNPQNPNRHVVPTTTKLFIGAVFAFLGTFCVFAIAQEYGVFIDGPPNAPGACYDRARDGSWLEVTCPEPRETG